MLESDIQRAIVRAINALPDARVERNNKWSGFVVRENGERDFIEAGLPDGSADLIGCVKILVRVDGQPHQGTIPIARAFFLEIKRPGEKQRPSQIEWEGRAHYMSAFYAVVRSVEEAVAAVERCRRGEIK